MNGEIPLCVISSYQYDGGFNGDPKGGSPGGEIAGIGIGMGDSGLMVMLGRESCSPSG